VPSGHTTSLQNAYRASFLKCLPCVFEMMTLSKTQYVECSIGDEECLPVSRTNR